MPALVHHDQEGIGFEENATIVVRDGVIASVTTGLAQPDAREHIDARGQVAMPGLRSPTGRIAVATAPRGYLKPSTSLPRSGSCPLGDATASPADHPTTDLKPSRKVLYTTVRCG